jgi:hypothetical protein
MSVPVPKVEAEFVYRRTTGSFAAFVQDALAACSPWWLFAGLALAFAAYFVLKAAGIRFKPVWLRPAGWIAGLMALALFLYNLMAIESGRGSAEAGVGSDLFSVGNKLAWYVFVGVVLALGLVFIIWQYLRDAKTIKAWAIPLAACRFGVYVILAYCFLQPAIQEWQTVEKKSKAILVIDVSPSIATISDEIASGNTKAKPRLEKILDTLIDEKLGLVKNLLANNPVTVYRFGARLDDEPETLTEANWSRADWKAFLTYDFKPFALKGLSEATVTAVKAMPAWKGDEPGNSDWAIAWAKANDAVPAGLTPEEEEKLKELRAKLELRVDVARAVAQGTNVPDSLSAIVTREAANMVRGIVVVTDGRSNLGSGSRIGELRERAGREKIPVFTVAVGEVRENIAIAITDVQAPDRAPPDEPTKIIVEADGIGLPKQEIDMKLDLFLPGFDPKKDAAAHTLEGKLTFEPGDPPHGQVEFFLDADKLPESLTEESKKVGKKRQLKQGAWSVVARTPRDKREVFAEKEHVSPPRVVQVIDKPLRILMWASGPTREYQTLRTLLVRETQENRAELSIYLQNEGGQAGTIVQDVPPDRLLTKFPTILNTSDKVGDGPDGKFYNLNAYDLIIAFDPDWTELSEAQVKNIQTWVDNLGGGLIYVAGGLNTFQLARADDARLKPLIDILPVLPEDIILLKTRPIPRTPHRINLKPVADYDVLKLDDTRPDDPTAGWENFFSGKDKYVADPDVRKNLNPLRGIFSFYPVSAVKPGATVLAEYLDINERGESEPKPYLVTTQPARGRTAFLGSGEIYRMRETSHSYYDVFWIKLARYVAANRDVKAARGRVLMNKEFISGTPVRVQARMLAPNGEPYPPNDLNLKYRIVQFAGDGTKGKEFGPYPLAAKKGGAAFDGYYAGQVLADPRIFPLGDFKYRVVIDVPDSAGETIEGEFRLTRSDPELDSPRPDFAALEQMASTLADVAPRTRNLATIEKLKTGVTDPARVKLAYKLSDTEKLSLIPEFFTPDFRQFTNRGATTDLWDKGPTFKGPPASWFSDKPQQLATWMLIAVGLLCVEWIGRKLLRLA